MADPCTLLFVTRQLAGRSHPGEQGCHITLSWSVKNGMQVRSGSGLLDLLMTGDPGAAGMRWLWALVADGGWSAGEGQGHDRSSRPPRGGTADLAAGSALRERPLLPEELPVPLLSTDQYALVHRDAATAQPVPSRRSESTGWRIGPHGV